MIAQQIGLDVRVDASLVLREVVLSELVVLFWLDLRPHAEDLAAFFDGLVAFLAVVGEGLLGVGLMSIGVAENFIAAGLGRLFLDV